MAGIAYLPNDPLAVGGPPQRTVTPGRVAAAGVNFDLGKAVAVGEYAQDTPEFGYWQARESLLLGLRAWREVTGSPLTAWYGGSRTLPVKTDAGDDLNAFYDRDSLQFFHHQFGGRKVHSCESVDVVCHEEGHALLDAIRPDFFEVPYIEVGAFHEAFGDCMALLSGLTDPAVCASVVAVSADLSGNHFLESLAEELGDAIAREYGPAAVERGALRHAANTSDGPIRRPCRRMRPRTSWPAKSTALPGSSWAPGTTRCEPSTWPGRTPRRGCAPRHGRRARCW